MIIEMVKDGLLTEKEGQNELDELESKEHNRSRIPKQRPEGSY